MGLSTHFLYMYIFKLSFGTELLFILKRYYILWIKNINFKYNAPLFILFIKNE